MPPRIFQSVACFGGYFYSNSRLHGFCWISQNSWRASDGHFCKNSGSRDLVKRVACFGWLLLQKFRDPKILQDLAKSVACFVWLLLQRFHPHRFWSIFQNPWRASGGYFYEMSGPMHFTGSCNIRRALLVLQDVGRRFRCLLLQRFKHAHILV